MTGKKLIRLITAILLSAMFFMGSGAIAFAEQYPEVRNGDIDVTLPDEAEFTEFERGNENLEGFEEIFIAENAIGEDTNMEVWYSCTEDVESCYFSNEQEHREYYNNYGKDELSDFYSKRAEKEGFEVIDIDGPTYEEYLEELYIPVTVRYEDSDKNVVEQCYMDAVQQNNNKLVHVITLFYDATGKHGLSSGSEYQKREILESYYDYGYDELYAGLPNDSREFRNGKIIISFPSNTETTEFSKGNDKYDGFEEILLAEDIDGGHMNMEAWYYSHEDVESNDVYAVDEESVLEYYDNYGKDTLEDLLTTRGKDMGYKLVKMGEPEAVKCDYMFVSVPVTIRWDGDEEDTTDHCYILPTDAFDCPLVSGIFISYGNDESYEETAEDVEMQQGILSTYYDEGYAESLDDSIPPSVISSLTFVLVVIIIIILIKKRRGSDGDRKPRKTALDGKAFRRKRNVTLARDVTFTREKKKKIRNKVDVKSTVTEYVPSSDSEKQYMESLETLRKSGLLTTSEMNEMLRHHAEVKDRRN